MVFEMQFCIVFLLKFNILNTGVLISLGSVWYPVSSVQYQHHMTFKATEGGESIGENTTEMEVGWGGADL